MTNLRSSQFKIPALIAITCLILAFWLYLKIVLFDTASYTSDLFITLQHSLSWLEGQPLLYDNCFGESGKIHNYYFTPLLASFTYFFGAYGLFFAHITLYLGSAVILILASKHAYSRQSRHILYFTIFVFLLGPLAFRIFDNPHYGFHVELLYVPLAILFVLSLEFRSILFSLLTAGLLIMLKEDGAVLGSCIHLSRLVMRHAPDYNNNIPKLIKKILPALAIWTIIFIAGILFLSYKNDFQTSRIGEVFYKVYTMDSRAWTEYFLPIIQDFIHLFLPLFIFIIFYFRLRNIIFFLLFISPILIVEVFSGLYYYPFPSFSLTWSPRLSLVWAFACAFLVTMCFRREVFSDFIAFKYNTIIMLLLGISLYGLQIVTLNRATNYIYIDRIFPPKTLYYPDEQKKLEIAKCIAKQLPRSSSVAPPHHLFGAFPYHPIVWHEHMNIAYKLPDVVLLDKFSTRVDKYDFLKEYRKDSIGLYKIYIKPGVRLNENMCIDKH